jgi:hypothetical protein
MSDIDLKNSFLPDEAAKYLGINVQKLNRLRRLGRLHGTQVGTTNLFTYTLDDLRKADLSEKKRGPKPHGT